MSYMKPEIFEDSYYEVDTNSGTEIIPCSVVGCYNVCRQRSLEDYLEGQPYDNGMTKAYPKHGWVARMSAPGYTDCTDWTAHRSEEAARDYLDDMYGDGEEA